MVAIPPSPGSIDLTPAQDAFIMMHAALASAAHIMSARAVDPTAYILAGRDPVKSFSTSAFSDLILAGFQPDGWDGEWWKYAARNGRLL